MQKKHGHTGDCGRIISPTYISWSAMKQRCLNSNHVAYSRYKKRGITVCDRWLEFANFLEDMGERPDGKTLDRIDNNSGYFKDNCKWSSISEQQNNMSNNIKINYNGKQYTIIEASKKFKIKPEMIRGRMINNYSNIGYCLGLNSRFPSSKDIILPKNLTKKEKIIFFRNCGCTLKDIGEFFGTSRQGILYTINTSH